MLIEARSELALPRRIIHEQVSNQFKARTYITTYITVFNVIGVQLYCVVTQCSIVCLRTQVLHRGLAQRRPEGRVAGYATDGRIQDFEKEGAGARRPKKNSAPTKRLRTSPPHPLNWTNILHNLPGA